MTDVAAELDQKLMRLAPSKARVLERLVREAMELADTAEVTSGTDDLLNLHVYPLPLKASDFERLREALDETTRELPRLRELLRQPGKFGHA
jgi:hypothetical protein